MTCNSRRSIDTKEIALQIPILLLSEWANHIKLIPYQCILYFSGITIWSDLSNIKFIIWFRQLLNLFENLWRRLFNSFQQFSMFYWKILRQKTKCLFNISMNHEYCHLTCNFAKGSIRFVVYIGFVILEILQSGNKSTK